MKQRLEKTTEDVATRIEDRIARIYIGREGNSKICQLVIDGRLKLDWKFLEKDVEDSFFSDIADSMHAEGITKYDIKNGFRYDEYSGKIITINRLESDREFSLFNTISINLIKLIGDYRRH